MGTLAFTYDELPVTVAYKGDLERLSELLEQHIDEIHFHSFVCANAEGKENRPQKVVAEFLCEHEGKQMYTFRLKEAANETTPETSRPGKEL